MNKLALALAASATLAFAIPATPISAASLETYEARSTATQAAAIARQHMLEVFGTDSLKPGQYLWREDDSGDGDPRVVIGLGDQLAYLYRDNELVAVAAISTGTEKNPTPVGIFGVLEKKPMHRSRKYDNAPMPFMQRIDEYGIALHAGHNPGRPASHGCVRLPAKFAAKLFETTPLGTTVMIGG